MEKIQQQEVEGRIPGGEAFGPESLVQGIMTDGPAVHRQEHHFPFRFLAETHGIPEPAFHPAPFIVIAPEALEPEILPGMEALHIEIPQDGTGGVEIFDQFLISHGTSLPPNPSSLFTLASPLCPVSAPDPASPTARPTRQKGRPPARPWGRRRQRWRSCGSASPQEP